MCLLHSILLEFLIMKKPRVKKLDNGLRIVTIPTDSLSLTVMVLVETGSRYEDKYNNGISHFLEHMCFKGTDSKTGKEIMRTLDGLGTETNAFTSYEVTGYYIKSIKKHWKKTLEIVSDIYVRSIFPEKEMEKEKGVILGEIAMYEDIPMRHIYDIFTRLVHGDQPAGWSILGTPKNVGNMKRDDFLAYHAKHYTAGNTCVVVAGDVQARDVVSVVEKQFAHIRNTKKVAKKRLQKTQKEARMHILKKKTDQTHIVFGYRTPGLYHKDALVFKCISTLLGGGMSSRLFEALREDMGVGYYVHAQYTPQSDGGTVHISCGIDSVRIYEVLTRIHKEINKLKTSLISKEELSKNKEYIIGNTYMGLEASDEQAYHYGQRCLFGLPILSPNEYAKKIMAITAKDLKRVAKKYFIGDGLNIAIIGPHDSNEKRRFLSLLK